MANLTPNEAARLHLKARHGTLTPEEQQVYSDYMARQLASAPLPEGGEPPKRGRPKPNVDIPDVLRKIAGIAVIVAALVILGPPIARYGLGLVDSAIEYRDSMNARLGAQQSGNAHYVATWHEAGTIDYKRTDLFISGEYFVQIRSDAHYGILSIICGARDADESDMRGAVGMSVADDDEDGNGWIIRDDALRSVFDAHGLSYDAFCSNDAAFDLNEEELADLANQVVSAITYGDIENYPVIEESTSFILDAEGHPYQDDEHMYEWAAFYGGADSTSLNGYTLDGSIDGARMFVDAQPTSVAEQ
ncbi:MAG: hypothetical protein Q4B91_02985 [Atopobiaceae bacterium]|nr:hypothetical protein [Atopobiaceae bacterium]